jgi:hypothetical protein
MSDTSTVPRKPDRGAPAGRPLIDGQCLPRRPVRLVAQILLAEAARHGGVGWWLGSRAAGQPWPFDVAEIRLPMNLSPERRSRHLMDLAAAHASQCRRSPQWCCFTATGGGPLAGGVRSKS